MHILGERDDQKINNLSEFVLKQTKHQSMGKQK